jgi:hypothetical protein
MTTKDEPVNLDDFSKIAPLVRGYELQPGKHYLIVCDGKDFKFGLAHALFKNLLDLHPELQIHVVGTLKPSGIVVMEKKDGAGESVRPTEETGQDQQDRES